MNTKKEQWNQFIKENKGSFPQSWQWGQLQESMDRKIWRIETEGLKGLIIKHNLPLKKNYLYCPYGPVGKGDFKEFLEEINKIAKQEKSIFFKIEPNFTNYKLQITNYKFIKSAKEIQPSRSIVLDISQSEEDLLKQMHQKTRYNIKLAQKKGIEIRQSNNPEALNAFVGLLGQTAKRDDFYLHPKEYYQKVLDILGEETVKLFLAEYQNKTVAAILVYFFGETAVYAHGASDHDHRRLMAPYLLQWHAILEAKKKGLKYYDFWGIDEDKWPGVTRFKKGFNGQEVNYSGAFNLIYRSTWHTLYNLARKIL